MKLFLFFSLISAVANSEQCVSYKNTEISGTLYTETFAGPPNYESIADGDKPETYFLLRLAKPACVDGGAGANELEENFTDIKDIQLVLNGESTYESLRKSLGKFVKCNGNLFSAHTGHHHTEILLSEVKCK